MRTRMVAVLYCISKIYKKGDVIEKKPVRVEKTCKHKKPRMVFKQSINFIDAAYMFMYI